MENSRHKIQMKNFFFIIFNMVKIHSLHGLTPTKGRTDFLSSQLALFRLSSKLVKSSYVDRLMVEAIFYVLRTAVAWRDLPACYGPWNSWSDFLFLPRLRVSV